MSAETKKSEQSLNDTSEETSKTNSLVFYPFAYALLEEELRNYCWYCLKEPEDGPLLKCSACKVGYFCKKLCQALGWQDHKFECKGLAKCEQIPDVEVRLLGRIASRYQSIKIGKDKYAEFYLLRESERKIMDIWSHSEDMRKDTSAWEKFEKIHQKLVEFYPEKILPDKETVFQLHCRNFINRHAISDKAYLKEIGKGLYLDLCAYDHSCRPNSIYTCDGFIATLRPLNNSFNINDRKTTFYSYIDLMNAKEHRQKMLKDSWYFECQCERCLDYSEHILTSFLCGQCSKPVFLYQKNVSNETPLCSHCNTEISKTRVTEAVATMRSLDKLLNSNDIENSPRPLEYLIGLLDQVGIMLPPCNIYYVRLLQNALRYTPAEDTQSMLKYHLEATDGMRVCYPKNHPALSLHLMNIGFLYYQLKQYTQAKVYLEEAQTMQQFVFGEDHCLTEMTKKHLTECNQALKEEKSDDLNLSQN